MKTQLTYEDFLAWKANPVTALFMDHMKKERETMKEEIVTGKHTDPTMDGTALKHADIIGRCTQIEELLNIESEQLGLYEPEEKEPKKKEK